MLLSRHSLTLYAAEAARRRQRILQAGFLVVSLLEFPIAFLLETDKVQILFLIDKQKQK